MIHILRIIAVIIAITYSLQLVNSRSDLLVFGGLAIVGLSVYFLFNEFRVIFNQLKSKL
jgi:hypothetical protein